MFFFIIFIVFIVFWLFFLSLERLSSVCSQDEPYPSLLRCLPPLRVTLLAFLDNEPLFRVFFLQCAIICGNRLCHSSCSLVLGQSHVRQRLPFFLRVYRAFLDDEPPLKGFYIFIYILQLFFGDNGLCHSSGSLPLGQPHLRQCVPLFLRGLRPIRLCYPFDDACRLYPSLRRGKIFWITMPLFVRGFFLLYSASPLREAFPFFGRRYPSS